MLGPLEETVIAALKARREGTTRDILEDVRSKGKLVAYTTVSTILMRLHAKGVIDRRGEVYKGGERYIYAYKDIEGLYIDDLLRGLVSTFGQPGVVHLAERIEGLGPDDVRRLRERLKA